MEPASSKPSDSFLSFDKYFSGLQNTINLLYESGKTVVYVTENPELKYHAKACLPRPFNDSNINRCSVHIDKVKERQAEYLAQLTLLTNVHFVSSLPAFCKLDGVCSAINQNNELLYADDDHLSVIGSRVQYDKVIKPYLLRYGLLRTD